MNEYLSVSGVAAHLGVGVDAVKGYRRRSLTETGRQDALIDETTDYIINTRLFPPPDAKIGNAYGWTVETIDAWNATRPGRGNWGGIGAKARA